MRNEVRYVIGAAIGALLAVMLGVPSFNADRYTESEPPLLYTYCDFERSQWEGECVPSGTGIILMVILGAGMGALVVAALQRRKPTPEAGAGDSGAQNKDSAVSSGVRAAIAEARSRTAAAARAASEKRSAQAQPSAPSAFTGEAILARSRAAAAARAASKRPSAQAQRSAPSAVVGAAIVEARSRTAATAHPADDTRSSRDDVVLEAAVEISAAVERKRDSFVQSILSAQDPGSMSEETIRHKETIERRLARTHLGDDVSERGTRLGIVNLAGTAVERAVEMGWLRSQGTGPHQLLFRTEIPLEASIPPEATSDSKQSAAASDRAEPLQEEAVEPSEDSDTGTVEASATERTASESLEELESLIRLHERGVLTDAELQAAKSRLLDEDDGSVTYRQMVSPTGKGTYRKTGA